MACRTVGILLAVSGDVRRAFPLQRKTTTATRALANLWRRLVERIPREDLLSQRVDIAPRIGGTLRQNEIENDRVVTATGFPVCRCTNAQAAGSQDSNASIDSTRILTVEELGVDRPTGNGKRSFLHDFRKCGMSMTRSRDVFAGRPEVHRDGGL